MILPTIDEIASPDNAFAWRPQANRASRSPTRIGAILAAMYRYRRQFDQRSGSRNFGPLHLNLLILLIAAAATNLGICLVNWLMHLVKSGRLGDFIGLSFMVGMVASLVLILGPAIYLNVWIRRFPPSPPPGSRATTH